MYRRVIGVIIPGMDASRMRLRPEDLSPEKIHIWPVRLIAADPVVEQYGTFLRPDEQDRARRFQFEHLSRAFILSQGSLRVLLSCYLRCRPGEIEFAYGENGKPALTAPSPLNFNCSHSATLALHAFALDCEIGVDIEQVRPMQDLEIIAARHFSSPEISDLQTLSLHDRLAGFYRCWTRKEAFIKATGNGLSAPLDSFRVTLLPEQAPRISELVPGQLGGRLWSLHNLDALPGFAGALAYVGQPREIEMQHLLDAQEVLSLLNGPSARDKFGE